uniref:Suv3_N domain-containing protein n=1 Tax=Gongylonema pulchrum TaxID=637853 RepID=A0A183EYL6_9BILA
LSKDDISRVLENFARRPLVRELSEQNNVNRRMFYAAYKYDFFLTVSLKLPLKAAIFGIHLFPFQYFLLFKNYLFQKLPKLLLEFLTVGPVHCGYD